jgi:hypothetical protein
MWNSRIAESFGDGAAVAVVVALGMSTPQGRRRKKVVSVGINDAGTTSTQARLNFKPPGLAACIFLFLFFIEGRSDCLENKNKARHCHLC